MTAMSMTSLLTWQADGQVGLEGVRVVRGSSGFRALGRMIRPGAGGGFTASYRLVIAEDGGVQRVSVTSATPEREKHLTINRTDDGFWLLDTGSGSTRGEFDGAVDVDIEGSPLFNTLPIRRLGLHREMGDHTLPMVFVSLPGLEVELVEQRYRTLSALDEGGAAVVRFSCRDVTADLVVDSDAIVISYPGLANRVPS
ncbi:putative glycolipid-binding domain-containing protein [Pseudonocardia hispaniensis]|uniref:Glycolipid-binding domain-containing protein n=1 Tax=Pseudonocardia hispaniensis TaxID=904933 RepID=A0ABW1J1W8_9PSEU